MNKIFAGLSVATLVAMSSSSVFASDSFDISVVGNITPAACKPALAGGNVFDYGNIPASSLSKDDFTVLPSKTTGISIVCDAPTKVALQTTDNRSGTENIPVGKILEGMKMNASSTPMGLGLDSAGNKIGAYHASIPAETVKLDTDDAPDSIYSKDMGASWVKYNRTLFTSNKNLFSWAKSGELAPEAFTSMTGTISVTPAISPASSLDLSSPVKMDGSVTVQLYYL